MASRADELQNRIHTFTIDILALVSNLPDREPGPTIRRQLSRSATSMEMNYRAARRARSHREFTSKIAVVAEEADETLGWLTILVDAKLVSATRCEALIAEARELRAILAKAAATARRNERARRSTSATEGTPDPERP